MRRQMRRCNRETDSPITGKPLSSSVREMKRSQAIAFRETEHVVAAAAGKVASRRSDD